MATKWQLEDKIHALERDKKLTKVANKIFEEELEKEFSEERLEKVRVRCLKRIEEVDHAKFY